MSIIDDIKRLERIGSEDSKTTQKIIEAAHNVADLLIEIMPKGVTLPKQYHIHGVILFKSIEGEDYLINSPKSGRTEGLVFAHDIATGLLYEFAEFLQKEVDYDKKAVHKLLRAHTALRED